MSISLARKLPIGGLRYKNRRHPAVRHGERIEPDALYIHWSGGRGNLDSLHRLLLDRVAGRAPGKGSYNYGIDRLGAVGEFLDPKEDAAWHSGEDYKSISGMVPPADQILEAGFLQVADVTPAVARWTNLRSVAICMCNEGFIPAKLVTERVVRGVPVVELEHANPASRSTHWEAYTDAAIDALQQLVAELVRECPTLRIVCGHEDSTNGYVFGRGKWAGGSKLDPGPAFPWDDIDWSGLVPVRFDYQAKGWRAHPPERRAIA